MRRSLRPVLVPSPRPISMNAGVTPADCMRKRTIAFLLPHMPLMSINGDQDISKTFFSAYERKTLTYHIPGWMRKRYGIGEGIRALIFGHTNTRPFPQPIRRRH